MSNNQFNPFLSTGSGGGGGGVSAAAVEALLAAMGDQLLDKQSTWAVRPTLDSDGRAPSLGDKFYLDTDDIGSGTAENPEHPKGIYRFGSTDWEFHYPISEEASQLLDSNDSIIMYSPTLEESIPVLKNGVPILDWLVSINTGNFPKPVIVVRTDSESSTSSIYNALAGKAYQGSNISVVSDFAENDSKNYNATSTQTLPAGEYVFYLEGDDELFIYQHDIHQNILANQVYDSDNPLPAGSSVTVRNDLLGTDPSEALASTQGTALLALIDQLDPDAEIDQVPASTFDETTLPAADKGDYYLFTDTAVITLNGTNYTARRGDVVKAVLDNTIANTPANWQFRVRNTEAVPTNWSQIALLSDIKDYQLSGENEGKIFVWNSVTQEFLFEFQLGTALGTYNATIAVVLWRTYGNAHDIWITAMDDPNILTGPNRLYKLENAVIDLELQTITWESEQFVELSGFYQGIHYDNTHIYYSNNAESSPLIPAGVTRITKVNQRGVVRKEEFDVPNNLDSGDRNTLHGDTNCLYMLRYGMGPGFNTELIMMRKQDPTQLQVVITTETESFFYVDGFIVDPVNREVFLVEANNSYNDPNFNVIKYDLDNFKELTRAENVPFVDYGTGPSLGAVLEVKIHNRDLLVFQDRNPGLIVLDAYDLSVKQSIPLTEVTGDIGPDPTWGFFGGSNERGYIRNSFTRIQNNEIWITAWVRGGFKWAIRNATDYTLDKQLPNRDKYVNYVRYIEEGDILYPNRQEGKDKITVNELTTDDPQGGNSGVVIPDGHIIIKYDIIETATGGVRTADYDWAFLPPAATTTRLEVTGPLNAGDQFLVITNS